MAAFLPVRADRAIPHGTAAGTFLSSRHEAILGAMAANEENLCACGCGESVGAGRTWKRGHASRGRGGYVALPGPDDPDDSDEVMDLDDGEWGNDWPEDGLPPKQEAVTDTGPGPEQMQWMTAPDDLPDDPPPAKLTSIPGGKKRGRKPTAGVKTEINAKVGLMLEIPARVWEARDPVCGGTFVAQRPAISSALTELILQSPDLVEWFMGAGGGFMLWLNLAAALGPVLTAIWAHHIVHQAEEIDATQPPFPAGQYAA